MRDYAIAGSMLAHRLRRWPNIEPPMAQWLVLVDFFSPKLSQLIPNYLTRCDCLEFIGQMSPPIPASMANTKHNPVILLVR